MTPFGFLCLSFCPSLLCLIFYLFISCLSLSLSLSLSLEIVVGCGGKGGQALVLGCKDGGGQGIHQGLSAAASSIRVPQE